MPGRADLEHCEVCGRLLEVVTTGYGFRLICQNPECPCNPLYLQKQNVKAYEEWEKRKEPAIPVSYIRKEIEKCRLNRLDSFAAAFMSLLYYWEKGQEERTHDERLDIEGDNIE